MAGLSLLRVVSNKDLAEAEKEQIDKELQERQNAPVVLGIAEYLRTCWDAAHISKKPIEQIMLKAQRQRNGEYEPEKLAAIRQQGGSEVFMMITEVKCRAAESWLRDILLDSGTPPWDLQPSPIPDLGPESEAAVAEWFEEYAMGIMQDQGRAMTRQEISEAKEMLAQQFRFAKLREAHNRTDKMKHKIADQFAQGGWAESFNDFITDLVTFPVAVLKGPVVRRQKTLQWEQDAEGVTNAVAGERIVPEYERVDPFRLYPEPGITTLDEGYVFEHHPLTRTQLANMIGVPGYDEQAIRKLLELGAASCSWFHSDVDDSKEQEERKFHTEQRPTQLYDALEFWGKISGKMLREWGMTEEEVPDPATEYDANVWIVGNYVIKVVMNYDPLGKKPYHKTSFIKCPGAFWGKGIPEIIEDIQGVCNAAARSLVNNMGVASGPQVEVNLERVPQGEDITQMYPWKIWQVLNDPAGSSAPAVRFNQPTDNSSALLAVYEKFSRLADEHSGIPAYLYGDLNVQGAGRTSSGLSMLMGSAGKAIRQVVMHIDSDVVKPVVHQQYIYNMRYDEDESIKGDVDIIAKGAINLATKETMNVRRIEFLNATANEIDMEIMGPDGRAAVLREVAKGLQMPVDDIIPSREEENFERKTKALLQAQQPQGGQPTPVDPSGAPKGGQDANLVMNRANGN